jgi:hypothetical protein
MPKMSKRTQYSDEISDDEIVYAKDQQTQNRKRLSKHRPYSDDLSDDEILYDDISSSYISSSEISSEYCEYFNDIFWFLSMDSSTYNILSSDISLECRVGFGYTTA